MKRLILMRHAKSDWSGGQGDDHGRQLNARGRKNAGAMGDWMRSQDLMPDQIICSSAARTRETLERLDLPSETPVEFTRNLYLATHSDILKVLQSAEGRTVLMLGHNPGISIAAAELLAACPGHAEFDNYPTCATLVADFDVEDWREAGWGKGNARHFVVPRDL
mgnify:CR=1 FL=1